MGAAVLALAALCLAAPASALRSIWCGQTIQGTYDGTPLEYTFTSHGDTTVLIQTCGHATWDTMLTVGGMQNDNMGAGCGSNSKASRVSWVARTQQSYTVTLEPGAGHDQSTGLAFGVKILCRPTQNTAAYTHGKFQEVAPTVNTSLLSCVESVWYYDGKSTCVGCGNWPDACPDEHVYCAGNRFGRSFGYTVEQARAVALALAQSDKRHPEATNCPAVMECASGEFQCANGNCLADTSKKCDCVSDCNDGSDENPVMCGYEELTCNGDKLTGAVSAGSTAGYYFSVTERSVVNPRTCVPGITTADTWLGLFNEGWDLITLNEDCGQELCSSNPSASGLVRPVDPGTYNVCIKPGAAYTGPPDDYAVELRCAPPVDNYWRDIVLAAGLVPAQLECIHERNTWMYDNKMTCVACGYFKDPCDELGDKLHCAGGSTYGTGVQQVDAVKEAVSNGGAYPGTTCAATSGTCQTLSFTCNEGQHNPAADVDIVQTSATEIVLTIDDGAYEGVLTDVHVEAVLNVSEIPVAQGNPKVGEFSCKHTNLRQDARPLSLVCPIPQGFDPACGTDLIIAVHADVKHGGSMWCPGTQFPGANWATYSTMDCSCTT